MKHFFKSLNTLAVVAALASAGHATADDNSVGSVAGAEPDVRPTGAPRIEKAAKQPGWYTRALTGVVKPYPSNLRFLEDQENWYTPFDRPGMPGYYNIRGWRYGRATR